MQAVTEMSKGIDPPSSYGISGTRTKAERRRYRMPRHDGSSAHRMSTMNSEVYDALIDAGATETKAREAAKSVAQYDGDIAGIKASLLVIKSMVGFVLAFVVAMTWRMFG